LSEAGESYANTLAAFIQERAGGEDVAVHTSTLERSLQTVEPLLDGPTQTSGGICWSALNNLNTGICHGMTVREVQEQMPEEFEKFRSDPFR
jgi:6-phosphofructo-2-kinase/fructose-2,6-biphosphatase 2